MLARMVQVWLPLMHATAVAPALATALASATASTTSTAPTAAPALTIGNSSPQLR